jgi:hypothetical protein
MMTRLALLALAVVLGTAAQASANYLAACCL